MIKVPECQFLMRALFLAWTQPPSGHVLTWLFLSAPMQERKSILSGVSSYKDTNLIHSGPHPCDLIFFNCPLRALSPNSATLEVRASTY